MMEAEFRIVHPSAKELHDSIACESSFTSRSRVDLSLNGDELKVKIEAKDFNALRAASNSYLRMLAVARDTLKVLP